MKDIVWAHHTAEYRDALNDSERKSAGAMVKDFQEWVISTRQGVRCNGAKRSNFSGISMVYHNGTCCGDNGLRMNLTRPETDLLSEYVALDRCKPEWLEVQAKVALALYQRVKQSEIPGSKTNGKNVTARYRKNRSLWLSMLNSRKSHLSVV